MQEYSYIIPVLIIIWVILLGMRIGSYLDKNANKNYPKVVPEKACPPHSWDWEEQPGMENVCYMWCKRCQKTPRQITDGT